MRVGARRDKCRFAVLEDTAMTSTPQPREPASMKEEEYAMLRGLLDETRPHRTLEIGVANGESTAIICRHVQLSRGRKHVAVDPFESSPEGWANAGIEHLWHEGLEQYLELIEDFDYLALPRLVSDNRSFDFVLIDGWHSFDYTLIDLFYADLLLDPGGVVVVHDSGRQSVYKGLRFLETHKPYDRLSPPLAVYPKPLVSRLLRRIRLLLSGPRALAEAKSRRTEWYSLAAYRKRENQQVADAFLPSSDSAWQIREGFMIQGPR